MKVIFAEDDVQFSEAMQRELQRCGFSTTEVCAKLNAELRGAVPATASTSTSAAQLTTRQKEVLNLVAQGRPNKHIARELDIAERTVKMHVSALFEIVNAQNRTHLLVLAGARGLI